MSGAGVRVDVEYDDREVRAALVRLIARMDDPRPVMDGIGQKLVTSVIHRFENESGRTGRRGSPRSERSRRTAGR